MNYLYAFCLIVLLAGCSTPKEQDYRPNGYFISSLADVKLSEAGKRRAQVVWDSIMPTLRIDSTATGFLFVGISKGEATEAISPALSFRFDSLTGPTAPQLSILFRNIEGKPFSYFYVGDLMVSGHLSDYNGSRAYEDTISTVADFALIKLINQKGIRLDTDRGPTQIITDSQAKALEGARMGYEALALLYNPLNKKTPR